MIYKEAIDGIRVDSGWTIDCNIVGEQMAWGELPFDDEILFMGVNKINGRSFTLIYENKQIGYSLDCWIPTRSFGKWIYDETTSIYKTIATSHNLTDIFVLLETKYLNPLCRDYIPLKISGWTINYNNLLEDTSAYDDVELLFSATRGKLFIDASFARNADKPYYVYYGMSKYKYTEPTFNLSKEALMYNEFSTDQIDELVLFLNRFLEKRAFP